jgi:uncharacterized membrane protein HdeD (DUF308 family)
MRVLSWLIALLGLWEFGDIAALFVPDFGELSPFLWNHILVGLVLMITGVWAARTHNTRTAGRLYWIAAAAGAWLIFSSIILSNPIAAPGRWNDIIVGALAVIFGVWSALAIDSKE